MEKLKYSQYISASLLSVRPQHPPLRVNLKHLRHAYPHSQQIQLHRAVKEKPAKMITAANGTLRQEENDSKELYQKKPGVQAN